MRARWIVAYGTAAAVAVAGVGFDVYRHHQRADTQRRVTGATLVDAAFAVSTATPPGQTLVQGGTQSFEVSTQSAHRIRTIELWDGNRRVDAQPGTSDGVGETVASFTYPGLVVGPHLLYARVVDTSGAVSVSAISNVDVDETRLGRLVSGPKGAESPTVPPAARLPVRAGETATSIAARLGVQRGDVSLADGFAFVAVHPPTAAPLTGDAVQIEPRATVTGGQAALSALPAGCGVTLHRGVSGAVLAEADANGPGFIRVGRLDAHGAASIATLTPGDHVLLAHSSHGDSVPISVLVPQSCAQHLGWTGNVTLIDGVLTLNRVYPHAYLYVQDGAGRPAVRFPASQDQYLPDGLRRIDLGSQAQAYGDKTVRVEVWSQQGRTASEVASGTYVHQGLLPPGDLTFPSPPISLTSPGIHIEPGSATAPVTETANQSPLDFGWSTANPAVTRVEWQVTLHPDAGTDDRPPDLVYDGFSYPGPMTNGAEHGVITIDPKAVLGDLPGTALTPGTSEAVLQTQLRETGGQVYVRAVGRGRSSQPGVPISIYLGLVSNSIALTLLAPQNTLDQFRVTSLTLDNGRYPNPAYADCVSVSGIHWTDQERQHAHSHGLGVVFTQVDSLVDTYPSDGRYCFSPPSNDCGFFCAVGQFFGTLLDGLEDAWDFIANSFNGLIDDVATLVADLNPICAVIGAAGSSSGKKDCKTITDIAAHAVISAVLAAYGIPPSLPTSAQIGQIAKGDLTELAEVYLEELGVPCDSLTVSGAEATALSKASTAAGVAVQPDADGTLDPCKAALNALLGVIEGAVAQQAQDTVATTDFAPPCPVDECMIKQDPTGFVQPPIIHIQAVRVGGAPTPGTSIPLDVSFHSSDPDGYPPFYLGGRADLVSADGSTIDATVAFTTPGPYGLYGLSPLDHVTITANLGMVTSTTPGPEAYLVGTTTVSAGFDPMAP